MCSCARSFHPIRRTRASKKSEEGRGMVDSEKGSVGISKEVVTAIAGIAVSEVDGIANLRSDDSIFRRGEGMKRYVDTEVEGENVKVTVRITAVYGTPIHKVAKQVQTRVKTEIERMTGLKVSAVNVDVQKLVEPNAPRPEEGEGE
ncbi:MAG TPA: Asp23/Gls24 family envelope stress response protein [Candidatus Acetothermia bacterium]|nr:Asp23/Gls24 family envelope stress response protein [Candidatus Acetothermia bacterium]